ncbi:MAG: nicotinate-nucleotide adenylyltransferase [Lachnospiraceae bacterium]|nr:nicotinate-nucleotide adenylyltransferase [Lachnospiraceae bacterium]
MNSEKRIGILGGTFNPIHLGHLMIAEQAYQEYHLDKVWIMPSGISYLKKNCDILPSSIRAEMVELSIASNPHLELSTIEVQREGNTYTYETLEQLKREYQDTTFFFIIGADTLFSMEHWKNIDQVFSNCELLVSVRNDSSLEELTEKAAEYKVKYNGIIHMLHSPNIEISSGNIRKMVSNQKSIKYYVTEEVENYIMEHELYRKMENV